MKVRSVQPTPNPNAFKFVLESRVIPSGVKNYSKAEQAAGHPLAERLFAIEGIDTLFFCDDFITVSMEDKADWRSVHDAVVQALDGFDPAELAGAAEPAAQGSGPATQELDSESHNELLSQINDLLDDRVRPALAGDGGGLEVLALEGKTLHIKYQGACGSCPSSLAGTLHAIQNLIRSEIDEEVEVVSV